MTHTFLKNKYTAWYFNIMNQSSLNVDGYLEKHHIIPKALGGNNDKSNIVKLTARQHFIAHLLLTKMTVGKSKSSMYMAAWAMGALHSKKHKGERYSVNNRMYEQLKVNAFANPIRKKQMSDRMSGEGNHMFGVTMTDESRAKMSAAKKGKYTRENNPFYGKTHSEETKSKISKSSRGRIASEETLKARSVSMTELYKDPAARKKTSDAMKIICNDPAYRAKRGWKPITKEIQ